MYSTSQGMDHKTNGEECLRKDGELQELVFSKSIIRDLLRTSGVSVGYIMSELSYAPL